LSLGLKVKPEKSSFFIPSSVSDRMSKFKFPSIISSACLMSFMAMGCFSAPAKSAPATVKLTTEPSRDRVVPYEAEATTTQQPVKLTLQAIDHAGQPLTNVRMKVKLLAPAATPWFTTDFPIVEGNPLLDIQADAPTGKLQLQQMLPIRGNYRLQVTATPLGVAGGEAIQQTIDLTVPENVIKYQNFAILALIIATAGLGGGWIIGARRLTKAGEIAPQPVRLLLSGASLAAIAALLYVNVSAEMAQSKMSEPMSHSLGKEHEHGESSKHTEKSMSANAITSQGIKLAITGDHIATVGKPANFQVKAIDVKTNQPVAGTVSIKTINVEKQDQWTVFGYQGAIDASGQLAWQSGLFDGSGHQVNVEFTPVAVAGRQSTPIKVSQPVEVEGVAPPLYIRLISLGYMTGIAASAFIIAFWLRRRQDHRLEPV
jgi:hypothetical protein